MSESAQRLLSKIVLDRNNGPEILSAAWAGRLASDEDLRGLVPDTWLYMDWPEQAIGSARWVAMFRAAGFIAIPYGLAKPHDPLAVFRGATHQRSRGMSWTVNIDRAVQFRQRHAWHAPTAIFRAIVTPEALLALLERRGEGPPEIVADPGMLVDFAQLGDTFPQRQRQQT
jgi:hypothetical protein